MLTYFTMAMILKHELSIRCRVAHWLLLKRSCTHAPNVPTHLKCVTNKSYHYKMLVKHCQFQMNFHVQWFFFLIFLKANIPKMHPLGSSWCSLRSKFLSRTEIQKWGFMKTTFTEAYLWQNIHLICNVFMQLMAFIGSGRRTEPSENCIENINKKFRKFSMQNTIQSA